MPSPNFEDRAFHSDPVQTDSRGRSFGRIRPPTEMERVIRGLLDAHAATVIRDNKPRLVSYYRGVETAKSFAFRLLILASSYSGSAGAGQGSCRAGPRCSRPERYLA